MSDQAKHPKLIVVMAFDRDEEGEPQPAFDPLEQQSEDRAIQTAKVLADKHSGVIAWSRKPNRTLRNMAPTLFLSGEVPDME